MTFRIRHIATRFALLLAVAAVAPLLAYGFVSLMSLRSGTRDSIITGNQNVATRAAAEIYRYISTNAVLLKALGADLQETGLQPWQQDRILKNYVLQFREFKEITLFDETGQSLASSRVGPARVPIPENSALAIDGVTMTPIQVDDDLLPTTVFGIHLKRLNRPAGWLAGEFSLEEMWRMVDRIRIGEHGFAMVVAPNGELVAHGDPDKKALVALSRNMSGHPLVSALLPSTTYTPLASEYDDEDGVRKLGVAVRIAPLDWAVVVEQPTSEAYAATNRLGRQLVVAISLALLVMISMGYVFGRSFISPILMLQRATQTVAAGQLDARVNIKTGDEFTELGNAFNTMANRLVELTENIKRQERHAMFGRVAAGLTHDLMHPIQNIGNNVRWLMRDDIDAESRSASRAIILRELETIKRFMEDLRNVVKPKPIERFALDINSAVSEIVDPMRAEGDRVNVALEAAYASEPLVIEGDRFALGRVFRNLITNAIQATGPGGRVMVRTARVDNLVEISVADTGSGIAPERLSHIFEDFVTTKRRGLGLGLAISKRIVEQLDGTITVESELGRGTAFTLRFPIKDDRTEQAAAS
jgi:signal transduction histidine kinase